MKWLELPTEPGIYARCIWSVNNKKVPAEISLVRARFDSNGHITTGLTLVSSAWREVRYFGPLRDIDGNTIGEAELDENERHIRIDCLQRCVTLLEDARNSDELHAWLLEDIHELERRVDKQNEEEKQ